MTSLDLNKQPVNKDILVVKFGSSSVSKNNSLDSSKISDYSKKLYELSHKFSIVIVSSGSVVAGKAILGKDILADASIYSMVGSSQLVRAWQDAFSEHGIITGQILVTHNDIADKTENSRLCSVIKNAISKNIVPIINENDVLSDIELAKLSYGGDNDGLASSIAIAIKAKELLLLTNVDGLIDKSGNVVKIIDSNNHKSILGNIDEKSDIGRGGMQSKIEAAVMARKNGVKAHIGNANSNYSLLLAEKTCTHIR